MNIKLHWIIGAVACAFLGHAMFAQEVSPKPDQKDVVQPNEQVAPAPLVKAIEQPAEAPATTSLTDPFQQFVKPAINNPNVVGWWEVIGSEDPVTHNRDYRRVIRADDESGDLMVIAVKSLEPRYPTRKRNPSSEREPLIRLKWNAEQKCFAGGQIMRSDWPVPFRTEVDFKLFPSAIQERLTSELNLNDQTTKKIEEIKEVVKLHRELDEPDKRLWMIVRGFKPKEEWKRVNPPNYTQIGDHLVVETDEELKVVNTKTGHPSAIRIEAPSNGETRIERLAGEGNFIYGDINNKMVAYSASARKWAKLPLDRQYRARMNVGIGPDLMSVHVDGRAVGFFNSNGFWMTPDSIAKTAGAEAPAKKDAFSLKSPKNESTPPAGRPNDLAAPANIQSPPTVFGQTSVNSSMTVMGPSMMGLNSGRIQGKGILIVETDDGIAGFSEIRGRWDRIVLPRRQDGKPYFTNARVGQDIAVVIVNNELCAFGSAQGKWVRKQITAQANEPVSIVGDGTAAVMTADAFYGVHDNSSNWGELKVPEEFRGKKGPNVGHHFLSAELGKKFYTLSSTTGKWTSPDEPENESVANEDPTALTPSASELSVATSKETKFFSAQIGQLEADALRAAAKVNELTKQHGADHESVKAARAELDKVLNEALDVRFLREEFRVKELRTRLGKLEQQIGQRKSQRATIIERRADELLNGGAFKWDDAAARPTSSNSLAETESSKASPESDAFRGEREQKSDLPAMERSEKELSSEVIVGLEMSIAEFSKQVTELKQKIAMQRDQVTSLEEAQKKAPKDELGKASLERSKATLDRMQRSMGIYEEQYKVARNDTELKIQKVRLEEQEMEDSLLIKGGLINAERVKTNALRLLELKTRLKLLDSVGELFPAKEFIQLDIRS